MPEQWHLRTDNATYGPKTRAELLAWAKIGRVMPGQEISADGEHWFPVQDVPFLNIRWSIDIGDGNPRGPFHKDAAEMLLRSGRIPAESKLVETRAPFTDAETDAFEAELAPPPPPSPSPSPSSTDGRTASSLSPSPSSTDGRTASSLSPSPSSTDGRTASSLSPSPSSTDGRTESSLSPSPSSTDGRTASGQSPENELIDKLEELHRILAAKDEEAAELRERLSRAGDERQRAVEASAAKLKDALAAAAAEKDAAVAAETARANARLEKAAAEKDALDAEWRRKYDALKAESDAAAAVAREAAAEAAAKLEEAGRRAAESERSLRGEMQAALDETSARAAAAEARAEAAAGEMAELVKSSNSREEELRGEIGALREKLKQMPPDADAAASVSSAVYKLMRAEADELAEIMETERREAEAARKAWTARADRMLARRQELLRRIGAGVEDMARIAVRERPDDPQINRLRQEREAMRAAAERQAAGYEERLRQLTERLNAAEAERQRLRAQSLEAAEAVRRAASAEEKLQMREKELLDERRRTAENSRRWAAERNTLTARIESLEQAAGISYPGGGLDDSTARRLDFPPWMGFKS